MTNFLVWSVMFFLIMLILFPFILIFASTGNFIVKLVMFVKDYRAMKAEKAAAAAQQTRPR